MNVHTFVSLLTAVLYSLISWDWRACMEDEYMFVDVRTGELIHPVHAQQR